MDPNLYLFISTENIECDEIGSYFAEDRKRVKNDIKEITANDVILNMSKTESEAMLKDNRKITDSSYLSVNLCFFKVMSSSMLMKSRSSRKA